MSSHADTIRRLRQHSHDASNGYTYLTAEAADALDALLAENQRLREGRAAVRRIALNEHATHTARLLEIEKLTREALAGDAE